MNLTIEHVLAAFRTFERVGLARPERLRVVERGAAEETAAAVRARATEMASLWLPVLQVAGATPEALTGAVLRYLADADRGRFWPMSPAELLRCMPEAQSLGLAAPMDPDEQAWERIIAVLRKGRDAPERQAKVDFREVTSVEEVTFWSHALQANLSKGSRTVTRMQTIRTPSPFEAGLTAEQHAAFRQIGGFGGIEQAETRGDPGIGRAALRKRFLTLCRTPEATRLEVPPERPALPDGAPAFLRMAFGAPDAAREAERARHLERAGREN